MKSICKLLAVLSSCRVQLPNCYHLLSGQFVQRVSLTRWVPSASLFCSHVLHVLKMRTQPQMSGINTQWVVAAWAIVKNVFAWGHRSVVKNPRKDVRSNSATAFCAWIVLCRNTAVTSARHLRCCPNPAGVSARYLGEKPFNDCWGKSLLGEVLRSYRAHVLMFARRALQGPASFFIIPKSPFAMQMVELSW